VTNIFACFGNGLRRLSRPNEAGEAALWRNGLKNHQERAAGQIQRVAACSPFSFFFIGNGGGRDGTYSGLAVLTDKSTANDSFLASVSNASYSYVSTMMRQ
jgi:hypothetical protein